MGMFDTTSEWVRPEIRALAERGNVTFDEYKALRCNSWEWDHIQPKLTDEALICAIEYNLKNCYPKSGPCETYKDALAAILAPEMLKRWRTMVESQSKACDDYKIKLDQAYDRGRREAIEEAASFLRGAAVAQIRELAEPGESPIQACATVIVKHEAYRGQ